MECCLCCDFNHQGYLVPQCSSWLCRECYSDLVEAVVKPRCHCGRDHLATVIETKEINLVCDWSHDPTSDQVRDLTCGKKLIPLIDKVKEIYKQELAKIQDFWTAMNQPDTIWALPDDKTQAYRAEFKTVMMIQDDLARLDKALSEGGLITTVPSVVTEANLPVVDIIRAGYLVKNHLGVTMAVSKDFWQYIKEHPGYLQYQMIG